MPRRRGWEKSEAMKRRWEEKEETNDIDKGYNFPSKSKSADDQGLPPKKAQKVKAQKQTQSHFQSNTQSNTQSHSKSNTHSKSVNNEESQRQSSSRSQNHSESNFQNLSRIELQDFSQLQNDARELSNEFSCQAEVDADELAKELGNRKNCVQGRFHQGHSQFEENSGRQCVANSLLSMVFSKILNISSWAADDLDTVLRSGDELYSLLTSSPTMTEAYLLVSDLPHAVELFGKTFRLTIGESVTGLIDNTVEIANLDILMSLDNALQKALSEFNACFVTFAEMTFAVIQEETSYCVFDSHSRNSEGMQTSDGTSVVIQFRNLIEVYQHCCKLASSLNVRENTQFEVTGINIAADEAISLVHDHHTRSDPDLIIGQTDGTKLSFFPITSNVRERLCRDLAITNESNTESPEDIFVEDMGEPCKTVSIIGDGNCFFRALSYALSGTERNHRKIRLAVVRHLKDKDQAFVPYLRSRYTSIKQYIALSRMQYLQTWATEVEILAAADMLEIDICTFSGTWLKFSKTQINKSIPNDGMAIYLKHSDSHYEVVECVQVTGNQCSSRCHGTRLNRSPSHVERERRTRKRPTNRETRPSASLLSENMQVRKVDYNSVICEAKVAQSRRPRGKRASDRLCRERKALKRAAGRSLAEKQHSNVKRMKLANEKDQYWNNDEFRDRKKIQAKVQYKQDEQHRKSVIARGIQKYQQDEEHREAVKAQSIRKYQQDDQHREAVKAQSIEKYQQDNKHREGVKAQSIKKYQQDNKHREAMKAQSIKKYQQDNKHRKAVKAQSIQKYITAKLNRLEERKKIEKVSAAFKDEVCHGPDCICSVCHRRLFRKGVVLCKKESYKQKGNDAAQFAETCISDVFVHECTEECSDDCRSSKLWICFTCHRKLLEGKMPAEAARNNLELMSIPRELLCLNPLEQHLVALHIPFMKMVALPRGSQHGVHGPVVCIPTSIEKATNILPRCQSDDQMIRVKLKRKLTYKGHYQYQFVRKAHVKDALKYLERNNKWYKDIYFNSDWVNPLPTIEEVEDESDHEDTDTLPELTEAEHQMEKDDEDEEKLHGMFLDTCLQPADIGQEVLDQHFDNIVSIAPAEGNSPVRLLTDEGNEAKSFPGLFPTGSPTFHDQREQRITLARYLHTRLMNADNRFSSNTDYIFYAQYMSEIYQVLSNVSIALRKGSGPACGKKVTSQTLTDKKSLGEILKHDEGYKFLRPIRGTPPFWQAAQKDLFAMLRQIGIPTWFCSFSSADMRWTAVLETILREEGDSRKACDLDWSEKCGILRRNPVTAARMFDHRFHTFLKQVIMSPAEPIGKIVDYFFRVEFQQRGSPHTHCLFWVENAPKIDKDDDEAVTTFVDKYVTCEMPSPEEDEELYNIVNAVQKHSTRHSKTCRKKGTTCRFGMPRHPSDKTFICRPAKSAQCDCETDDDHQDDCDGIHKDNPLTNEEAKAILEQVWKAITDPEKNFETVESLFEELGISQELLEKASNKITKKTSVVLQRNPQDIWVNQYNPHLLRCWDANMDIQYINDAYSCVVYILSYISKAEKEMGLLLDHAQKEAGKGNLDAKQSMKRLGGVYLHNREVSAQEAVYRVCNLRLKEGSRKVQFIPTGVEPIRMSLPLDVLKKKGECGDLGEEDIWMTSLVDRYKNRPKEEEFENMCLASFCSEYRVLSKSEISSHGGNERKNPIVKLENGLGFVLKRSRTDPAIVRYARFSPTRDPEKYYQSLLQLFLPYTFDTQLKPPNFESYEDFYQAGAIKLGCNKLETVKAVVDRNRALFEKETDVLDRAEEQLNTSDHLEDAWAQISPETEAERLSCLLEQTVKSDEPNDDADIPDLLHKENQQCRIELRQCTVTRDEAEPMLRSLNAKQSEVFYTVRQWCLNKSNGKQPEPFHVFVTGGGGTGKSHLIKTIYYEATRILAHAAPNPDDISVLLTAPTGVAAFNIGAATIHSTFSIGINLTISPVSQLGQEKLNTLRSKLDNLQILIIDEISMVDDKLLIYVDERLKQIKQNKSPFGNVSVIAVGDFYQLPPVMATPLFSAESKAAFLWDELFSIAELTDIMRQKDATFAETLNRLRIRKIEEPLNREDMAMLQKCETGEESPAIHIFATNAQVDDYNVSRLHLSCSDPVCIEAQDFTRTTKTGKLDRKKGYHSKVSNTNLARTVTLAVGARVLLTKNIDVSDGLVNGVFGTVSHIAFKPGENFPSIVYVVFDNDKVGQEVRKKKASPSSLPQNSTPLEPQEDKVCNNGGVRRQFPLRLAWACTIHKVQGLTLKDAVVSLKKIKTPGQAYVALSRVTSVDGLIIEDLKESTIFCNEKVENAVSNMPQFLCGSQYPDTLCACTIIMHNIEGLKSHIQDLGCDSRFLEADFICLTETWLCDMDPQGKPELNEFTFFHKPRSESYGTSQKMLSDLKQQSHGGVGVYFKDNRSWDLLHLSVSNLEYMAFYLKDSKIAVAVVYRPQSYIADVFRKNLLLLVEEIGQYPGGNIIMGDFNENILVSSSIQKLMENQGFVQCVTKPTTESGTIIDHVYVRRTDISITVDVLPTYVGFHEAVCIKI